MEDVKIVLRSILISTPVQITVKRLNEDYKEIEGEDIPYKKLGYNSLPNFLHEMPDVLTVRGYDQFAVVQPVISDKVAHIKQLVCRQKVCLKKPGSFHGPTPVKSKKNTQIPVRNTSTPLTKRLQSPKRDAVQLYTPPHKKVENIQYPSVAGAIYTPNTVKSQLVPLRAPKVQVENNASSLNVNPDQNDFMRQLLLSKPFFPLQAAEPPQTELDKNSKIPQKIIDNLAGLISKFPEGIWSWSFPSEYKKLYGQELDYENLGFERLINLFEDLPEIFQYKHYKGHFMLYDATKSLPNLLEMDQLFPDTSHECTPKTVLEAPEIHVLDWSNCDGLIPEDSFRFGMEISREFLDPTTQVGDRINVVVADIYDISKFWFYKDNKKLDNLMDEMQNFYRKNNEDYLVPKCLLKRGFYCVSLTLNEYHRGLIINMYPEQNYVKIFYIDYGTVGKAASNEIWFLSKKFSELPSQAIRGRMAAIYPPVENMTWTKIANNKFRQMACMHSTTARIDKILVSKSIVELSLEYFRNRTVYIHEILETEKFALSLSKPRKSAIVDPNCVPKVKYIHLFPTFEELENGLVPSPAEMESFPELDIDFFYPHYFTKPDFHEEFDSVQRRHRKMLKNKDKLIKFIDLNKSSDEFKKIHDKTYEMTKIAYGSMFEEMQNCIEEELKRDENCFKEFMEMLDKVESKEKNPNSFFKTRSSENTKLNLDECGSNTSVRNSWKSNLVGPHRKIEDPAEFFRLEKYLSEENDTSRSSSARSSNTGLLLDIDYSFSLAALKSPTSSKQPAPETDLIFDFKSKPTDIFDEPPSFNYPKKKSKRSSSDSSDLMKFDDTIEEHEAPMLKPEVLGAAKSPEKEISHKLEKLKIEPKKCDESVQTIDSHQNQIRPAVRPPPGFENFLPRGAPTYHPWSLADGRNPRPEYFPPFQQGLQFPVQFPPIVVINYTPPPIYFPNHPRKHN